MPVKSLWKLEAKYISNLGVMITCISSGTWPKLKKSISIKLVIEILIFSLHQIDSIITTNYHKIRNASIV